MSTIATTSDTYWPSGIPRDLVLPDHTLDANLEATAATKPDKAAIIYHGRTLTYAGLLERVERLAGFLQQKLGVAKGDRVLLYMQNSPQFVISYYGILRAGAVVIPVNPMNRHAELQYLAQDTGAEVMIHGSELSDQANALLAEGGVNHLISAAYASMIDPEFDIPLPDGLRGQSEPPRAKGRIGLTEALAQNLRPTDRETGPDDMAVIPYSSGTTGQPKGCVHTHRSVMITAVGNEVWNPSQNSDVHLATLPLFHVTGMQNSMNTPVYNGGTVVMMSRWDCVVAAQLIKRYRITRWRSITPMVIDMANHPDFDSFDLTSLKGIGGGGAAVPEAVALKLKQLLGLDYIEGYGLSEMMAATHMNPLDAPKPQCLGVPIFGVDSRIVAPGTTTELPHGEVGEILTHAPQCFAGYWNKPDDTAAAFADIEGKPFLRTGDLGYRDDAGFFFMVDRVKRMVNVSGFKVWPAEVEALLHHHPDIAEACIVGSKDPRRGEIVKAYVVAASHVKNPKADAIIDWCRAEMAAYKCPRVVEFTDALPKSGSGKVLWRELT